MPRDHRSCSSASRARLQRFRRRPRRSGPAGGGQEGQATLEYAGAVAVVAMVLAVASLAAVDGGGWVNGVVRGVERAMCKVTGRVCTVTELTACTVRSRETAGRLGVKLTFIKLGASLSLLREELSDGTVDVTLVDGTDAAPTAALGASGGVRTGDKRFGGAAITKAELLVRLGRRRVWHRPDGASADRLVKDIAEHVAANVAEQVVPGGVGGRWLARKLGYDGDRLPPPDVSGFSGGVEGLAEAELGDLVKGNAAFKASLGGSRDRETGRTTFVFSLEGEAGGKLSKAIGGAGLTGTAGATLTVVHAEDGTPLELSVAQAGSGRGDVKLGVPRHEASGGDGGRVEVTSRLDLEVAASRAVYDGLLAAMAPGRQAALPGAIAALADRLDVAARRDEVRYASDVQIYGAEGELAVGARVGGAAELKRTSTALQEAWTRPAGGAWERRTDCVPPQDQA